MQPRMKGNVSVYLRLTRTLDRICTSVSGDETIARIAAGEITRTCQMTTLNSNLTLVYQDCYFTNPDEAVTHMTNIWINSQ